ncbi:MAG TPA: lysozyme inhibitor LprI family protein [Pyrinomonadaceae bacterium]|jgi:uncharacterized protein YecT (DUF1311 family)|nr:lysozyme inhibitor LprI family protein [Pyrinomonadaceae bacterium]
MKKVLPALLLSCAALLTTAPAQKRAAVNPCDDARTQLDMNICADKQFKIADAELNRVYNQLASKLEEDKRAKLKAAEVSWLKYRDSNCDYEASLYEGGSMQPMTYSFCLERMTKSRTTELREQLKELNQ